jgi:hypothetical protein
VSYTAIEHDGFSIETNTGDDASVRASLGIEEAPKTDETVDPW